MHYHLRRLQRRPNGFHSAWSARMGYNYKYRPRAGWLDVLSVPKEARTGRILRQLDHGPWTITTEGALRYKTSGGVLFRYVH